MNPHRSGRTQDEEKTDAFVKVAKFLQENDDEQITVGDLIALMSDYMADCESTAYGHTHMKAKLLEHFGDQILITEINGKANVVTFRSTAETILQEFHAHQKDHPEQEKMYIIQAAAKLTKNDIKLVETSTEHYPPVAEIKTEERCLDFLPDTLKLLLQGILTGKDISTKLASIGQAIMQAARPRVPLAPLQVGLGIQLHHHLYHVSSSTPFTATDSAVPIKKCRGLDKKLLWIKELKYRTILLSLFNMLQIMLITT